MGYRFLSNLCHRGRISGKRLPKKSIVIIIKDDIIKCWHYPLTSIELARLKELARATNYIPNIHVCRYLFVHWVYTDGVYQCLRRKRVTTAGNICTYVMSRACACAWRFYCPFSMINADLISDSIESDFILSLLDSCLWGLRARFGESAVMTLQFEQHWASWLLLSFLRESKRTKTVWQALRVQKY